MAKNQHKGTSNQRADVKNPNNEAYAQDQVNFESHYAHSKNYTQ